MDTHLIWTPHYYGQFALSLGKESPYIFSKFSLKCHTSPPPNLWGTLSNGGLGGGDLWHFRLLKIKRALYGHFSVVLSVSVLTGSTVFSVQCRMLRNLSFTITSLTHNHDISFFKCSLHGWLYRMILPPLFRVQYFTCGLQESALYRVGKFGDQRSNKPLWTLDHYRLLVAMCCC